MQADVDWVGRELQRLAKDSKLLRAPTEAEWNAIWQAATKWADAYGVVANGVPIDEFVRKHAPGVMREAGSSGTNPHVAVPPAPAAAPVSSASASAPASYTPPNMPDPRERGRRYPRINGRPKAAPAEKPAAG